MLGVSRFNTSGDHNLPGRGKWRGDVINILVTDPREF
ncbi:hypothetical protein YPPY72_2899, partial [Yersinia pestis PY-72]